MDPIFKALNDPARRAILDLLRHQDGQTLSDLEAQFDMTRFGVMKHLGVLEEAGLVTTKKIGRFKHHYLNAVPLQQVMDRWIEPFLVKPATRSVLDLKSHLEGDTAMSDKPDYILSTYIHCTQDALWDALTDPEQMSRWHFLSKQVERDGDDFSYLLPDGTVMLATRHLKEDPKTRIEATFEPKWAENIPPSRTIYLIQPGAGHCRLTIEHYGLGGPATHGEGVADGWDRMVAGLKTFLETGDGVRFNERGTI